MNSPGPEYDVPATLAYLAGLGLPEPVAHAITDGADPAHPEIAAQVHRWAARIMSEIDSDIVGGQLPAGVATWTGLHEHVDANEYLDLPGNQVPWGTDLPPADGDPYRVRLTAAVEDEVNRRLAARTFRSRLRLSWRRWRRATG